MQIQTISFTPFKAPGQKMFGSTPLREWQRYCPINDDGSCNWALRSLLIHDGANTVLIDSGFAPGYPEVFEEYGLINYKSPREILANSNVHPDSVTHVIHTHLHLDHCGGSFQSSENGIEPLFKIAEYVVSKNQMVVALNPEDIEKDSFQPEIIKAFQEYNMLQLIDNEIFKLPWLELLLVNGHTKGLFIPVLHSPKQSIAFVGDLIPSAAHLILSSTSAYDMNPLLCLAEREEFLEEAFENEYILFFQHDYYNECCTLKKENSRIVPAEFFMLEEILKF